MKVAFSRPALIQLGAILDYVRERNPRSADQLAERIDRACGLIGENPYLGRKHNVEGVRRKIVQPGGYLIFYSIEDNAKLVSILAVSRPAQDRSYRDV